MAFSTVAQGAPAAVSVRSSVLCRRSRLATRCVASPDAPPANGAATAGKEYGRKFNFSAGPACLPVPVLEKAQKELLNWQGTSGMSVMEMSHRGKEFKSIIQKAEEDLRTLLAIPDNYKVLFLQGGASTQFASVPLNLTSGPDAVADYVVTGAWGKKAVKEAKKFCNVNIAATSESTNFTTIPDFKDWNLSENADYVHICSNETIGGVEFKVDPPEEITKKTTVVADMSSNFCSKPVDVSRYGIIYAGAQKNIGPAGVTVVIVREDLAEAGKARASCPSMLDYSVMAADPASLYNTPSGYGIYICGLVFGYLLEKGGLEAVAAQNEKKAAKLYDAISASDGFYQCPVEDSVRSLMNVPYRIFPNELEGEFLKEAEANELLQLKGHRSVGGLRASIYNSMPEEGIDALVSLMKDFQSKHT